MKTFVPDYYRDFACIADRCRHSCCIGWEIDVDEDSYRRYQALEGPMGREIRSRIALEDGVPHYILGEGDRCPFLREDGLCRQILALGEEALCQICTDHPRFRNCWAGRTEVGLGLCCEAAGDLILKRKEPFRLVLLSEDEEAVEAGPEEQTLLSFRDMLLSILLDRSCTLDQRLEELLETCGGMPDRPLSAWAVPLLSLERLDEGWTEQLEGLKTFDGKIDKLFHSPEWECAWEQAAVYFLYRHLPAALEDGDPGSKAAFAVLSARLLRALCQLHLQKHGSVTLDDLVEYARMYSSEIEYSEENLWQLFDWLTVE